ncbi:MAG TPA: hypothetical protein VGD72_07505 [Mycobacteriales bacterium]|jgi:hypothetical protein
MARSGDTLPRIGAALTAVRATPTTARRAGVLVVVVAFLGVNATGSRHHAIPAVLACLAVVAGLALLLTPPRGGAGTGWTLAGVGVGAVTLVVVVLQVLLTPSAVPVPVYDPYSMDRVTPVAVFASSTLTDPADATRYAPENLVDHDISTVWLIRGDGVGQRLTFFFARPMHLRQIDLTAGYTAVDPDTGADMFTVSRRLEHVTFVFDDGRAQGFSPDPASRDLQAVDVDVTATKVVMRIDATTPAPVDVIAVSDVEFLSLH